jgi:hypothetical protein
MPKIMSDNDVLGEFEVILAICQSDAWREVWSALGTEVVTFEMFGLAADAPDAQIWRTCQVNAIVLVTGNRNAESLESLEATIRSLATAESLPVMTIADRDRLHRDRRYAERAAERLLEYLMDLDGLRGAGRLCIP